MVKAVTLPPCSRLSSTARLTASTSNAFSSFGTPSRTMRLVSGSKRTREIAGTHLTQTAIFMALLSDWRPSPRG